MKRANIQYALFFIIFGLFSLPNAAQAKNTVSLQVKLPQYSNFQSSNSRSAINNNLRLFVQLHENILVADEHIQWEVFGNDKLLKTLKGKQHDLKLPTGIYRIALTIGHYQIQKRIHIKPDYLIQPYFPAEIGHLKLSSNYKVDWKISNAQSQVFTEAGSMAINEIVPAGTYNVQIQLHEQPKYQRVRVKTGQRTTRELTVPLGEVSLIAIKNNQPLFDHMQWDIFRLHSGRRQHIERYNLHSKHISLPAGLYEAVALFQGKQQKRRFWVQKNGRNQVVLALD